MKKLSLGTTAFAAVIAATAAVAADLPPRQTYKAPIMAPVAFSWTGCYIGGHAGGAWSHLNMTDVAGAAAFGTPGQTFSVTDTGFFGGGQAGCNYQTGQFVFGIEGDLGWMGVRGSALDPGTTSGITVGINDGLYGDVTGRAGVAFDQFLLYGKGGWAFFNGKETFSTTSPAFISNTDTGTFSGWVAGAGIEYHIWSNWSAKVEYLHYGFGSQTFNVLATGGTFPFKEKLNVDTVKVGLNFKLF
jgi:outer membrane immunogenic protein